MGSPGEQAVVAGSGRPHRAGYRQNALSLPSETEGRPDWTMSTRIPSRKYPIFLGTLAAVGSSIFPFGVSCGAGLESSMNHAPNLASLLESDRHRWRASCRCISFLAAILALGCGGKTSGEQQLGDSGSSSGGPSDTGGSPDAGSDSLPSWDASDDAPWSAVCPIATPTIGSACNGNGTECEYGDAWWNVSCDTIVACSSGQWSDYEASGQTCLPAPAPNSQSCPPDYGVIVQKSACPNAGLECFYGQGAYCECLGADAALGGGWRCLPETGCPSTRPRLGSPCDSIYTCTYAECAYAEVCSEGVWQSDRIGCSSP